MPFTMARAKTLARFYYTQRVTGFTVTPRVYFGGAEDAFRERLSTCRSYLEFGSGSSTLAAAEAGIPTVSVERDRLFARAVQKALPPDAPVRFAVPYLGPPPMVARAAFFEVGTDPTGSEITQEVVQEAVAQWF